MGGGFGFVTPPLVLGRPLLLGAASSGAEAVACSLVLAMMALVVWFGVLCTGTQDVASVWSTVAGT